ncbi:acylglycerol kinase, mitochondrial [Neodiprion virginianus]|uniref:acylglycerol kinase, mitochondrial n=1 Tax=Neodiprion virginianus TaxID=2961670 RepID=UPI001EE6BDBD|nr:acylglycerol kinase, mitochondrial [Neodiprion virginianus]
MARIIKFFKIIRSNWKKSTFALAAISYGGSYGIESYNKEQLMRRYCEDAVRYGDMPLPVNLKPRHVTVILNPAANKRKAKDLLEKYCAPLLHLAGIAVTFIQTESEGQARSIVENLNSHTDAIVVAGGDGSLSDVVTGVMRRCNTDVEIVKQCPIGILPLGQTNNVAKSLFNGYTDLPQIHAMAEATMAVVRGTTKLVDTIEIEPLEQDPENIIKPVYAVGTVEWGAWRDANAKANKYWYWGSLRRYATYVFNGYKSDLTWDCSADLRYSEPCNGCSRCRHNRQSSHSSSSDRRWWHSFVPRTRSASFEIDYSKVINEKCGSLHEIPIVTTELKMITSNLDSPTDHSVPAIKVHLGPETVSYLDFVKEGWKRADGHKTVNKQTIEAKDIELRPRETVSKPEQSKMFSIDNEEFELKPIRVKLLPKSVTMFCAQPMDSAVS